MEIVDLKISNLEPYDSNPKKHPDEQINKIAESIKEFGFKVPILVSKDREIIAGHGRLLAMRRLGRKTIPSIIADDLTEEQIKAFRIMDNRLTESEWDYDLLSDEIEELEDLDVDLELTGFEDYELNQIRMSEEDVFEEEGELEEEYEEPEKDELKCPNCGHIDSASRFEEV